MHSWLDSTTLINTFNPQRISWENLSQNSILLGFWGLCSCPFEKPIRLRQDLCVLGYSHLAWFLMNLIYITKKNENMRNKRKDKVYWFDIIYALFSFLQSWVAKNISFGCFIDQHKKWYPLTFSHRFFHGPGLFAEVSSWQSSKEIILSSKTIVITLYSSRKFKFPAELRILNHFLSCHNLPGFVLGQQGKLFRIKNNFLSDAFIPKKHRTLKR